jgi:hypothetical protein
METRPDKSWTEEGGRSGGCILDNRNVDVCHFSIRKYI